MGSAARFTIEVYLIVVGGSHFRVYLETIPDPLVVLSFFGRCGAAQSMARPKSHRKDRPEDTA